MLEFIQLHFFEIIKILALLLGVILFSKKSNKNFLEVFEMLFKTNDVLGQSTKGQNFTRFSKVYRLNKATGDLEDTGDVIDVHELIQSCKDTSLDACLEKYLPNVTTAEDTAINYHKSLDVLDAMLNATQLAEKYRDELELDSSLSFNDIFKKVKEHSDSLANQLKNINVSEFEKKSEVENEKEVK